ncbi:hypothetical protein KSB_67550 [Ktedonobacter robiniae]|uniref:PD-(D/E)XK endonuclease-like domain-containing protein n=1 Tax=Ktedonobacter robiniae TaxID=2778365 RepID=A0ABQ3V0X1_9CHLR|nr:hypothetical protein KSB_67550 [Ktedonobacter robiniae]
MALSRARDVLYISYARRIGNRRSQPSSLLALVERHLTGVGNPVALWEGSDSLVDVPATVKIPPLDAFQVFDVERLDRYLSCPRQYYYEFVLDLRRRRTDSAYIQFHRCVYGVLSWLQDERRQGRGVDEEVPQRYLLALWEVKGPREHPYEMMYQQQAAILVTRAIRRFSKPAQRPAQAAWEVPLTYGRVRFTPDVLEIVEGSTGPSFLIQRLRTGQVSQSERDKEIYALYHRGVEQAYPGANRWVG